MNDSMNQVQWFYSFEWKHAFIFGKKEEKIANFKTNQYIIVFTNMDFLKKKLLSVIFMCFF